MTIYTVIITDLDGKYLGCKFNLQPITLVNVPGGGVVAKNGLTNDKVDSSIGIAYYEKTGREKPEVRFIDKANNINWVKALFKSQPDKNEEEVKPEWADWSITPPPHLSTVFARRYGAAPIEVDTKYLPATFDPHGTEWKLK